MITFFGKISCENADMFSSVNNSLKLYRMPKVSGSNYFFRVKRPLCN